MTNIAIVVYRNIINSWLELSRGHNQERFRSPFFYTFLKYNNYKSLAMSLRKVPADSPIETILSILEEDGGLILQNFLPISTLETIAAELKPFEQPDQVWKGNFFPEATKRICGTVGKSQTLASKLLCHPVYREVCLRTLTMTKKSRYGDEVREFKCYPVGNASTTFDIGPGAEAQQLHRDDGVHHLSHPNKQPYMIGLLVAQTRTTPENGATVVIPGSHKWVRLIVMLNANFTDKLRGTGMIAIQSQRRLFLLVWNQVRRFCLTVLSSTAVVPIRPKQKEER